MATSNRSKPLLPAPLLKAASRLMRPLIRLMMHNGVTFPVLVEVLRGLFVEIAVNDLLIDPKSRTDSRISILTGVHRKEIRRLRESPTKAETVPGIVTLGGQVIARWVGDSAYLDTAGQPRSLDRANGVYGPGFDALVESVTTDIRPRAMLEDLLSHSAVFMDQQDRVQLNSQAFIPHPGGEEQLFYFARNLHDHVAAATANISAGGVAPFLDRSVHYDGLTTDQADALCAFARESAIKVLLEVNRRALALTEAAASADGAATRRVNFGIYLFGDADGESAVKASVGGMP